MKSTGMWKGEEGERGVSRVKRNRLGWGDKKRDPMEEVPEQKKD